jgi:hypothetical protein
VVVESTAVDIFQLPVAEIGNVAAPVVHVGDALKLGQRRRRKEERKGVVVET